MVHGNSGNGMLDLIYTDLFSIIHASTSSVTPHLSLSHLLCLAPSDVLGYFHIAAHHTCICYGLDHPSYLQSLLFLCLSFQFLLHLDVGLKITELDT